MHRSKRDRNIREGAGRWGDRAIRNTVRPLPVVSGKGKPRKRQGDRDNSVEHPTPQPRYPRGISRAAASHAAAVRTLATRPVDSLVPPTRTKPRFKKSSSEYDWNPPTQWAADSTVRQPMSTPGWGRGGGQDRGQHGAAGQSTKPPSRPDTLGGRHRPRGPRTRR